MQRSVKLAIPLEDMDDCVLETIRIYNSISNQHVYYALKNKACSKNTLHKALYKGIRTKYPDFPSALVQCARDHAVGMLKGNGKKAKTVKNPLSGIRFDLRTCKVFLESGSMNLATVDGRKRINFNVPEYFQKYASWEVKGCVVGVHKRFLFIHVVVDGETPTVQTGKVLGIDRGLKNFVVCSNGIQVRGNHIRCVKRRYAYLRRRLQACGTRNAINHLKVLAGRERRFMQDVNHTLSKRIAGTDYNVFALEDLTGIRKGNKGRRFNRMRSNWAFFQFQKFLEYKAESLGKSVVYVDPRFTSQRCCVCGFVAKANRHNGLFHCKSCGRFDNADLNASVNISQLGQALVEQATVNQPIPAGNDGNTALHLSSTRVGSHTF